MKFAPVSIHDTAAFDAMMRYRLTGKTKIDIINEAVADYFGMTVRNMMSETRMRSIVLPRQIAMYLALKKTHYTLTDVGRVFGGKDHTTVFHARRKIERLRVEDREIAYDVRAIEERLG